MIRLSDEAALVELSEGVRSYYMRVKDNKAAAVVSLMHVEHLYYKHDTIASAVQRAHEFNKTWGKYSDLHPASLGKYTTLLALVTASSSLTVSPPSLPLHLLGKATAAICESKVKMNSSSTHPASFMGNPSVPPPVHDAAAKLEELCQFIFKYGDDRR